MNAAIPSHTLDFQAVALTRNCDPDVLVRTVDVRAAISLSADRFAALQLGRRTSLVH